MSGPSTVVKSGRWGKSTYVYDNNDVNNLQILHNDDFTWEYGVAEDVDVFEGGERVVTLKGNSSPVTGSFSMNYRGHTAATAAMFMDVVYYRSYVRSNWTPTNGINGTDYDDYGQYAEWTLKETIPEPSSGAGTNHITQIDKVIFKGASNSGDVQTDNITYRGWAITHP